MTFGGEKCENVQVVSLLERWQGVPHLPSGVRGLEDHICFGVVVSHNEVDKAGLRFFQCVRHPSVSLEKVCCLGHERI